MDQSRSRFLLVSRRIGTESFGIRNFAVADLILLADTSDPKRAFNGESAGWRLLAAEAETYLIHRLTKIRENAKRKAKGLYSFEKAGMRYLEEIAEKPSADNVAMRLDQLFPFIGKNVLEQVHDGTLKPFDDHEVGRGLAPKSINNVLGTVSAVLNRAARVWRTDEGTPWLRQAPHRLSRLCTKGRQAKPRPTSRAEQNVLITALPDHLAAAALFTVNTGCR